MTKNYIFNLLKSMLKIQSFLIIIITPTFLIYLCHSQSPSCVFQCQNTTDCTICYNSCRTSLGSQSNTFSDQLVFSKCNRRICTQLQEGSCISFDQQVLTQSECVKTCCNYLYSLYFTLPNLRQCISNGTNKIKFQQSNSVTLFVSLVGGAIVIALCIVFLILKIKKMLSNRSSIRPINQQAQLNASLSTQVELSVNKSGFSTILKTEWVKSAKPLTDNQSLQNCSICLENNMNCRTQCGHKFHLMCLKEWIKKSPDCPLCKSKKFNDVRIYCLKCRTRETVIELKSKLSLNFGGGNTMSCDECKRNRLLLQNSWAELNSTE